MPRTNGATLRSAGMTTSTLAIVLVGAVVVAGAIAGGVVLMVRRGPRGRAEAELVPPPAPAPQAGPPPGLPDGPPAPQAPPPPGSPAQAQSHPAPPAVGAPATPDLPELVAQPKVPGGWRSVLAGYAAPADPATITPEGVDERDPAELAQAAAAAEADEEAVSAPAQPEQELAPVPDTPSELVVASSPDPSRLRLLGLVLGLLTERTRQEQPPQLGTALARLGDGDQERARAQLSTLSLTLMGEDQLSEEGEHQLSEFLGEVLGGEMANGFGFSTMPEFQQALNAVTPELRHRLDTIVWSRNADAINILTAEDVEVLERVAVAMTAALILDTTYGGRRTDEDAGGGDAEGEAGTSSDTDTDPGPE